MGGRAKVSPMRTGEIQSEDSISDNCDILDTIS